VSSQRYLPGAQLRPSYRSLWPRIREAPAENAGHADELATVRGHPKTGSAAHPFASDQDQSKSGGEWCPGADYVNSTNSMTYAKVDNQSSHMIIMLSGASVPPIWRSSQCLSEPVLSALALGLAGHLSALGSAKSDQFAKLSD
jgi:hypothetical protein